MSIGGNYMDNLKVSIKNIFKGAVKSLTRFPASILSAAIISIVAFIRIYMDWDSQQTYAVVFNSLQLSFLLAAVFSMALTAYKEVKHKKENNFKLLDIAGIVLGLATTFLLIYFTPNRSDQNALQLSGLAVTRVTVATTISAILFVYIISKSTIIKTFSKGFFITHKAFVISTVYGLVILSGVSGVIGAFKALVYNALNPDIYQYLAVIVGFTTFTIFLGYFPRFDSSKESQKLEVIKELPQHIYVLFNYIMAPIMLALTVVLLIWSATVIFNGVNVSFFQLSSITSSYVLIGIWIHIMISENENQIANFYRLVYPFSAILVLAFEAWALYQQVNLLGITTTEYSFAMLWIFALIAVILLIAYKASAYSKIAITAIVVLTISVLPYIGYDDITFNSQLNQLETVLINENILMNNKILKANDDISQETKVKITTSVNFLANSNKDTPSWFYTNLDDYEVFRDTFGFDKTYNMINEPTTEIYQTLFLSNQEIDISEYDLLLIKYDQNEDNVKREFEFKGDKYLITWKNDDKNIPELTVTLNEKVIINENLLDYLEDLKSKYIDTESEFSDAPFADMSVTFEQENISVLLVFENIDFYDNLDTNRIDYYTILHGIYIDFK